MTTRTSPTFRRQRLGRRLRQLREQAGITQENAAIGLEMSTSALSRKEIGEVGTSVHELRSMMDLYDHYEEALLNLARQARVKPWWRAYGIEDRQYIDLETEACALREWQFSYVPGLLQTPDYARAVYVTGGLLSPEETENEIAARMTRQEMLSNQQFPLSLTAIVDESVLTRPLNDPKAMRGQLEKILELAELPNVEFRVLPTAAGLSGGMEGSFTLLSYPEADEPDILYVEHPAGPVHVQRAEKVERATGVFAQLQQEALGTVDSTTLVRNLADDL